MFVFLRMIELCAILFRIRFRLSERNMFHAVESMIQSEGRNRRQFRRMKIRQVLSSARWRSLLDLQRGTAEDDLSYAERSSARTRAERVSLRAARCARLFRVQLLGSSTRAVVSSGKTRAAQYRRRLHKWMAEKSRACMFDREQI